jgi:hypothetical protein
MYCIVQLLRCLGQLDSAPSRQRAAGPQNRLDTVKGTDRPDLQQLAIRQHPGKAQLVKLWEMTEFLKRAKLNLKQLLDPKDPDELCTVEERMGPQHLKPLLTRAQLH